MYLLNTRNKRIAAVIALAVLLGESAAVAGSEGIIDWERPHNLSGAYGFTTLQSCVRTPYQAPGSAGFDPVTHKLLVNAEAAEAIGSGTMSFGKDGTVSAAVVGAELAVNQLAAGQTPESVGINYSCNGSYTVLPDNSLSVTFPACTVSTGNPNQVVTVGPLPFRGYVGEGKHAINLSLVDGSLQTVSVADAAGNVLVQRQRLCIQSLSLDKVDGDH